jgi:AmmeMemoRadiSam system protein B
LAALLVCVVDGSQVKGGASEMKEQTMKTVQRAWGAGRWFPGSESALRQAVVRYMADASPPAVSGRVVSAIAPHAGYQYSGPVAGYTFRVLRDQAADGGGPETVVVLGFTHRNSFAGCALLDGDAVRTPLGAVALDREAAAILCAAGRRVFEDGRPHRGEHSAENEIPFVQAALPDAGLVVALIGDHEEDTLRELVAGLEALAKKKRIVVVASTDLLHDPDYDRVTKTDKQTLALIEKLDDAALLKTWSLREQVCCGIAPVAAAIRFARTQGKASGRVLHYRNSGDDYPESRGNWVVGYGAVVFTVSD